MKPHSNKTSLYEEFLQNNRGSRKVGAEQIVAVVP
jgi:hypothetical protein